jgi:hypothetical protein
MGFTRKDSNVADNNSGDVPVDAVEDFGAPDRQANRRNVTDDAKPGIEAVSGDQNEQTDRARRSTSHPRDKATGQ